MEMNPEQYLINSTIFADEIKWEPLGNQAAVFKGREPKVLFDKIIVAKLRENQEIEIELFCTKNIGTTHTKWSPVSTAYYRLKPLIEILEPIKNEEVSNILKKAEKIVEICPMNVFGTKKVKKGEKVLDIEDAWSCTMCRECIRPDGNEKKISLGKERQVYKFHVESIGVLAPEVIFTKALKVLKNKCVHYINYLKTLKKEKQS